MLIETPVFSVITPTRNRPQLLKRCMRSVSEQTFSSYEHIIIDDGADPDTRKIVDENQSDHTRYLRHESSRGAASSYNSGIHKAKGALIFFLDDDDEAMPSLLEKLNIAFSLRPKNVGFVLSGIEKVVDKTSGEEEIESIVVWPEKFSNREESLIAATTVGNVGVCIRKECFSRIGLYDEGICFAEDTDLIFRMLKFYNFSTIKDILVRKHKHSSFQLTSDENYSNRIQGMEIILDRYKEMINSLPKLHSVHYSSYAYLCYRSSLKSKGRKAMLEILERNPGRMKSYLDLISLEILGTSAGSTLMGKLFKRLQIGSN